MPRTGRVQYTPKRGRRPVEGDRSRVVVYLPTDLLHAIDHQARQEGRSRTSEMTRALSRIYCPAEIQPPK
jgi:hypothetical protein